jgi:hypothetical protein
MPKPQLKSPLNADVAIDSSTNDNGYLKFARKKNPRAGKLDVATGVLVLANKKSLNAIISHGSEGTIHAGSGIGLTTAGQLIDDSNVSKIGFNELGKSTGLRIYACHTGAGGKGAQLLFDIAKQTKCPVYAPTGFIFLDDKGRFSLQTGARWQTAKPSAGGPPSAKPQPPPPQGSQALPSGGIMSWSEISRPWERVTHLLYDLKRQPTVPCARGTPDKLNCTPLSQVDAQWVVNALGLARAYRIKGAPGALHTGDLEFEFEGAPTKYAFRVLADRLIEDVQTGLFYFTSAAVSSVLNGPSDE